MWIKGLQKSITKNILQRNNSKLRQWQKENTNKPKPSSKKSPANPNIFHKTPVNPNYFQKDTNKPKHFPKKSPTNPKIHHKLTTTFFKENTNNLRPSPNIIKKTINPNILQKNHQQTQIYPLKTPANPDISPKKLQTSDNTTKHTPTVLLKHQPLIPFNRLKVRYRCSINEVKGQV